ncbi:MAG: hypothetical protein KKA42_13040 [candidate division Zixibacteria bacterium]|nr:hypothetical protein [candidate division Zixibacteria bacterium]
MKQLVALSGCVALCLFMAATVAAVSTPKGISYQGRVVDADGHPVADGSHEFQFRVYTLPEDGSLVLSEDISLTTFDGLFSHILGSVTPIPNAMFLENDSLFLEVTIDGETQSPRTPFLPVGYALRVNSIDATRGGTVYGSISVRDTLGDYPDCYIGRNGLILGSGRLRVYSLMGGSVGVQLDGSYAATGQPSITVTGSNRSIVLNTSESGSASVELPADAIEAAEILDEPGVGNYLKEGETVLGATAQYLGGRTMFAPADGFVYVSASAEVIINHTSGTYSECFLGLSDNLVNFPAFGAERVGVPAGAGSGQYHIPFSAHMLFPVTQGSQPYYLMGNKWVGAGTISVRALSLTEIFIPTAYTTVISPFTEKASDGQNSGLSTSVPFDPETERNEAIAFNRNRIASELARIAAECESLKQQLRATANEDSGSL